MRGLFRGACPRTPLEWAGACGTRGERLRRSDLRVTIRRFSTQNPMLAEDFTVCAPLHTTYVGLPWPVSLGNSEHVLLKTTGSVNELNFNKELYVITVIPVIVSYVIHFNSILIQ